MTARRKSLSPRARAEALLGVDARGDAAPSVMMVGRIFVAARESDEVHRILAAEFRKAAARGRRRGLREAAALLHASLPKGERTWREIGVADAARALEALAESPPIRRACVCHETSMRNCPAHQNEWNNQA